ncbi:hypothetical protein EJ110_NYTH48606 [Nymphaea thermarum]|nr:hypothetical protein EJ110_NYTH48606 [Nymphaea thermarum]
MSKQARFYLMQSLIQKFLILAWPSFMMMINHTLAPGLLEQCNSFFPPFEIFNSNSGLLKVNPSPSSSSILYCRSGYLAPEYAMRGHLTEKADVFGFGVLALEVISGRPNADNTLDQKEWAWHLHEKDSHLKLLDPTLNEYDEEEALRVYRVALLCTQASPSLRPRMSRVIAMLSGNIKVSAATSRPAYLTDWQFKDISSTISTDASSSTKTATSGTDGYQSTPITTGTITPGSHSPYRDAHPIFQHSQSS